MTIDALMYLTGDEDCGVGAHCRECDRGGLPIVYYSQPIDRNPYKMASMTVISVDSVNDLVGEMYLHVKQH